MFRAIVFSLLLAFSGTSLAQTAVPNPCENLAESTKGLTESATRTLLESCRTNKETGVAAKMADPDTASKWADAAKGFAVAIGIAAKELGIAVNDFLDSPAGYLLALVLLFNYAGGFIVGLPLSLISMFAYYKLITRMNTESLEYEMSPVLWGAFSIRRVKRIVKDDGGEYLVFMNVIFTAAFILLNLLIWLNVT